MKGLTQARKRNMERMAEKVPESDDQSLQHFLSNSPWDERPVVDQVARDANTIFNKHPDTGLYIDETGFVKKGTKSVVYLKMLDADQRNNLAHFTMSHREEQCS